MADCECAVYVDDAHVLAVVERAVAERDNKITPYMDDIDRRLADARCINKIRSALQHRYPN
jgi:hypothetical protein